MAERRYQIPERCVLIGGFVCELTSDERNRWHEHVSVRPEYKAVIELALQADTLEFAVRGGATAKMEELRDVLRQYAKSRMALYDIAKAWYAGLDKAAVPTSAIELD